MPLYWLGDTDSDRQLAHRPRVAGSVQPVEHPVRASRAEQLRQTPILWHGRDGDPRSPQRSTKNDSETLREGAR
jgi:hypothetical protein